MRKIFLLTICFYAISCNVKAQHYKWQANVDNVSDKGFYNILIPPSINGNLNTDFTDIRLFDDKNKEIPYLHRTEIPITNKLLFKEYKIVSKEIVKGCCTRIVLENKERGKINNVSIAIKNADVQKKFKLSGSDDKKVWFVIKDNYLFHSIYSDSEISEIKLLNFPLSNYPYYKIEINDSVSAPINILKIGYYDTYSEKGKYVEVPEVMVSQEDSIKLKKSFVKISFGTNQVIDKLDLEITGPAYYLRKANICELKKDSIKKRKSFSYFNQLQEINLASNELNTIYFSNLKTKELYLIIDNADNQALQVRSAKAYQLNNYLTAYLEKGKKYVLKYGDDKLAAPNYDLKYFQDSIPPNTPLISTGKITGLIKDEIQAESSWSKNKAILWVAIGLVVVLLTMMSVKMIKEMK